MRKIYHIEYKNASEKVGISKYTLDRKEFQFPFENEICIIRKSELVTSKRSVK